MRAMIFNGTDKQQDSIRFGRIISLKRVIKRSIFSSQMRRLEEIFVFDKKLNDILETNKNTSFTSALMQLYHTFRK